MAVTEDLSEAERWWSEASTACRDIAPNITLGTGEDVLACPRCGSLWRGHRQDAGGCDARYLDAEYTRAALDRIWDRCTADYAADHRWLDAQGLGPGARVLEVGTYAGAFLAWAAGRGCDATGVDVNPAMVAYAQGRGVDARVGVLRREEWGSDRFDQVWILNCFEQAPSPRRLLAESHAVLHAGGRLVLRTPNADFVAPAHRWRALRASAMANHVLGMPFLHCFTVRGLRTALAATGFELIEVRGREFAPVPPPALSAAVRSLGDRAARRALAAVRPAAAHPWIDLVAIRRSLPSPT